MPLNCMEMADIDSDLMTVKTLLQEGSIENDTTQRNLKPTNSSRFITPSQISKKKTETVDQIQPASRSWPSCQAQDQKLWTPLLS